MWKQTIVKEDNMIEKTKVTSPRYHQIAVDIAHKIVDKQYKEGDKIFARSYIASQYGVSSETARRAFCILAELGIVDMTKGSGVVIRSFDKAYHFVNQYKDLETLHDLKKEMLNSVKRQEEEMLLFSRNLTKLIEKTERLQSVSSFMPQEIAITKLTPYLNQTVSEVNFWHNTHTTIIAIKRGNDLIVSPGPYASFLEGDIFYYIGDETSDKRVASFLYPN